MTNPAAGTSRITSRFNRENTVFDVVAGIDLRGRNALVTGGGGGFGWATARALALAGADVCIADIDEKAAHDAIAAFRREHPDTRLEAMPVDLASQASVHALAERLRGRGRALHILVNNAGIMATPQAWTVDGFELQLAVNYLGHYTLTRLLEPMLREAGGARVVCVSSIGHRRSDIRYDDIHFRATPYNTWDAYGQSKTACALLAVELDRRWRDAGVRSTTLNPGGSLPGLHKNLPDEQRRKMGWLDENGNSPAKWRVPEKCAATATWLAVAPELRDVGGLYFEECQQAVPWTEADPGVGVKTYAIDPDNARRLWEVTARMTGSPA